MDFENYKQTNTNRDRKREGQTNIQSHSIRETKKEERMIESKTNKFRKINIQAQSDMKQRQRQTDRQTNRHTNKQLHRQTTTQTKHN